MGGVSSDVSGIYFSLSLHGAKEGPKLEFDVTKPVEGEDGKVEWEHVGFWKGIVDSTLLSIKENKVVTKDGTIQSWIFTFVSGPETYGLRVYANTVSRKMLENIFWCRKENRYDMLNKCSLFVFKGDSVDQATGVVKSKKTNNVVYFQSFDLNKEYGRFYSEDERKKLIKEIKDGSVTKYLYGEYDESFVALVDELNSWLKSQRESFVDTREAPQAPGGMELKGEYKDNYEKAVEADKPVNPVDPAPAPAPAPAYADDLPF